MPFWHNPWPLDNKIFRIGNLKMKTKLLTISEGRDKMRKLTYTAALLLLSFVGCMQESNVTGPINSIEKTQAKTIIMLPERADVNVESVFTSSLNISGVTGGQLEMIQSYQGTNGKIVNIDCKLTVPSNSSAFADSRDITMQVSDQAGVDFYPSMTFSQPVLLNFTITGLDLNGIDPADVNFYYVDQNGNLAPTVNDGVSVNLTTGTLTVVNAQLPHFSRWAYAR
jgi:hypothetical protein